MHSFLFRGSAQLLEVTIEAFDLGEKSDIIGKLIQETDGILRVHSSYQTVTRIADRPQVAGSNITSYTDYSKIPCHIFSNLKFAL